VLYKTFYNIASSVSYQLSAHTFVRFRTYPRNASWQRIQRWRKLQG